MRNIQNDIKQNSFRRVYVLYGDEAYLVRELRKQLTEAICGENTLNLMVSEEGVPEQNSVYNFLQTFPVFSDYRLAVIADSGLFSKAAEGWDELIKNVPDTAVIVFVEKKVDKRLGLYKAAVKMGDQAYLCELNAPDEKTLQTWVLRKLKSAGKKITEPVYNELVRREGENMENLTCEIEKLIAYTGEREIITLEDIDSICSPHPSDQVFLMIDAVLDGKQNRAMELYNDLLALRIPAAKTLALLGRQCNQLFLASGMTGSSQAVLASTLKIPPFAAKKLLQKVGRDSQDRFRRMVELCVEYEYRLKSGRMNENLAVESLIVELILVK